MIERLGGDNDNPERGDTARNGGKTEVAEKQ
jgi:hypothetical protein